MALIARGKTEFEPLNRLLGPQTMPDMPEPGAAPNAEQMAAIQATAGNSAIAKANTPALANAMAVWRGEANEGRATNGDILRRTPNGQVTRTSARYGYTETLPSDGDTAAPLTALRSGTQPAAAAADSFSDSSTAGYPTSQPASDGRQGGLAGLLQKLFGDPDEDGKRETMAWLQAQGLDAGAAQFLTNDKNALRSYVTDYIRAGQQSGRPDWQMQTVYDASGNEQRVLMDMNNPGQFQPIGGAKTNLKTPAELDQAKEIAAAGKSEIKLPSNETEYDKSIGKAYGDRFIEIQKDAQSAQRAKNSMSIMEQSLGNVGFYSGTGADQVKRLKQFGAALGFDPEGVQDMETFNAMSKQAALDVMGGSLGTGFSNADRDFVIDQVPNLGNTPQGNKQLIEIQRQLADRRLEIAKQARDYATKNGGRIDAGFDEYLAGWAEQNPLFPATPSRPTDQTGPERVRNPQPGARRPRAKNGQGQVIEFDGSAWVPVQ
ncbi:MAG: hypothetical protein ABS35_15475 [Kaistia sp. SCN 65-12]|nr:MAG: hypothetical protein ABS35_15475 [Kaistia sp. SCN 65-12]